MITINKLKEYAEYHGYYDAFYIQKVKRGTNLASDTDWILIGNLIQDIRFVQKNLAAESFIGALNNKLAEACDHHGTIEYLKLIAAKGL